jgi:hypothetical protein
MQKPPFRAALKFFRRDQPRFSVVVTPLVALLPREVFSNHPDVLREYDLMQRLNAAVEDHRRQAAEKAEAARQAQADYQSQVTAALAAGKPAAAVKNDAPRLEAESRAHASLAEKALKDATAHGYVFGAAIQRAAADCFGPAEQAMAAEAVQVRAAVAGLRASWARWAVAWAIRERLSFLGVQGGTEFGFEPPTALPEPVSEALTSIERHLGELDVLRHDEAEVVAFRKQNSGWDQRAEDQRLAEAASLSGVES